MNLEQFIQNSDRYKFLYLSNRERQNLLEEAIELLYEYEEINNEMHSYISGYLHGEDWEHWQEYNGERLKVKSLPKLESS